jgi:hypothetical protein
MSKLIAHLLYRLDLFTLRSWCLQDWFPNLPNTSSDIALFVSYRCYCEYHGLHEDLTADEVAELDLQWALDDAGDYI